MVQTLARLAIVLFMISLGIFLYARVFAKGSNKGAGVPLYFPILLISGGVIGALPSAFAIEDLTFALMASVVGFALNLIAFGILIRHVIQTRT